MADLFLSYARPDRARAARVAAAVEADGRDLWWDRLLPSGSDYGAMIEEEIAAADRVVVAWSATARTSLWVRAEANEALDQGKIVPIAFDRTRPPLPFNMLQTIDFAGWNGGRDSFEWRVLAASLDGGQAPVVGGRESPLQGFGAIAALGWAALAAAILVALATLLVSRGLIPAEGFGWMAIAAFLAAALLLAASAFVVARISLASRR